MLNGLIFKFYNTHCRNQLEKALPGILDALAEYSGKSDTTGTKFTTLWLAVHDILKFKPQVILEAGTGASTIFLAAAVKKLRAADPTYKGHIISMESVPEWHEKAQNALPETYRDCVEIVLGPREKMEIGFYRGYHHSNIPKHNYEFVLIDGPNFQDEHGTAFNTDVFVAMGYSSHRYLRGVIDTRATTAFVLQSIFGTRGIRYWHFKRTARFKIPKVDLRAQVRTSKVPSNIFGKLRFIRFRKPS